MKGRKLNVVKLLFYQNQAYWEAQHQGKTMFSRSVSFFKKQQQPNKQKNHKPKQKRKRISGFLAFETLQQKQIWAALSFVKAEAERVDSAKFPALPTERLQIKCSGILRILEL